MAKRTVERSLPRGIVLIVAAFFFSSLTGFVGKFAQHDPVSMTVFVQYLVSFVCFAPLALRHGRAGLATKRFPLYVVRSLSASGAQLLFFRSLAGLPLLDASLLSNSSPLFIPLIVFVWLRKPVRRAVAAGLVIGLVGIVLVIHPNPTTFEDPASLVALGSGLLSAIGLVTTNRLADSEPPYRILFYNFGISTLALLPYAALTWRPLPLEQFGLLLLIGVFFAGTQYCIIMAYRYANASELSPFNYSVVIFSGLLGWLFFGNTPGIGAVVGTVLIIAGGIASIEFGHREGLGHAVGAGHWTLRRLGGRFTRRRRKLV